MIPTSSQFEVNRQAASNVPTYKAFMTLPNLAFGKYVLASSNQNFASAVVNGNRTHRNYNNSSDPLFPYNNAWLDNVSVQGFGGNRYLTIDLGVPQQINKIRIFGHPLFQDVTTFDIQHSLAGIDNAVHKDYLKIQGFNWENTPVPSVSVDPSTGLITTNATAHDLFFTNTVWARYITWTAYSWNNYYVTDSHLVRVAAIEIYRTIDVTADVVDVGLQDSMTYNLKRRMSKSFNLTLRNYDKRYSPSI